MRILVIEDEQRIAQSLKKGLEQERMVVDIAYTGHEGYDLAATEEYDVILLDLMLPGMSGTQICTQLRQNNIHTPVLMLTAKSELSDKIKGLDIGADDYLTKPFAFEELLARVRALALTLNTKTFEVSRDNHPIKLSNREYSLLEFLMRHASQVISKDQIMNHVWSYDADILPNTIEVTIRHLRQKIDAPFSALPKLIHTVRGFGYKIGTDKK
jgi:DNA-binding response OmpR family regulator